MPAPPKLCRSWPQERDPKKIKDSEAQEEKKMVVYQEQYKATKVDHELDEAKVVEGEWHIILLLHTQRFDHSSIIHMQRLLNDQEKQKQ